MSNQFNSLGETLGFPNPTQSAPDANGGSFLDSIQNIFTGGIARWVDQELAQPATMNDGKLYVLAPNQNGQGGTTRPAGTTDAGALGINGNMLGLLALAALFYVVAR